MADTFLKSMQNIEKGAKDGEADLKLSADVQASYVKAIHDFRDTLNDQLTTINGLPGYGDPGKFVSAQQTKQNLINGCELFKRVIGDYIEYLDEFAKTVNESASRLIKSG